MFVALGTNRRLEHARSRPVGSATAEQDYTVTARITHLRPNTRYFYRVWFQPPGSPSRPTEAVTGTFRTAPPARRPSNVRFVFGGDLGSGGYCRHRKHGYPIFYYMTTLRPDFFVALGDMIYADGSCREYGPNGWENLPGRFAEVDEPAVDWTDPAALHELYFEHWRYNRADRHLQFLLGRTGLYSVWDDHEIVNDSGASWSFWTPATAARPGYRNIVAAGRDAFLAYGAIGRDDRAPLRLYRSFRWGRDLQLLLLDTRSYRSRNEQRDTPENKKTMLGAAQLSWLKRQLRGSKATWKVIASSVSLTVPNGSAASGRDGWADGGSGNGFERELLDLLRFLDAKNVKNVVFIAADLHFPQVTRSRRDYDGDGDAFVFHELIAGPLNARVWAPYGLDATTNPTQLYAEGNLFSFGYATVSRRRGRARLHVETRDSFGRLRPGSAFELVAR
jgi:alkaline phosphatase D